MRYAVRVSKEGLAQRGLVPAQFLFAPGLRIELDLWCILPVKYNEQALRFKNLDLDYITIREKN